MKLRLDINALRALAVISVVIYHYQPDYLSGGFVGVDIFFVISGYLMTKIILTRVETGSFGILDFYKSRALRILPPLFFLSILLICYGFFTLPPIEYASLGKHVSSSLVFLSNFVYWSEVGYFDDGAKTKWLLHTWSLSVEWQFYIIFPIFLVILSKISSTRIIKRLMIVFTTLGIALSAISVEYWPSASYYLLPTRAWEMLLGGVAFLYPINYGRRARNGLALLGLGLIFLSIFSFSENYLWPGYMALVPVLGTYLCICSNTKVNIFTENWLCYYIGRASYSIYLWHWPILVAVVKYNLGLTFIEYFLIVIISSSASFLLIEQRKWSIVHILFLGTLLTAVSLAIYHTHGFQGRVSEIYRLNKKEFHEKYYGGSGYKANRFIHINSLPNNYDYMMIGDSYGLQYVKSLDSRKVKVQGLFDHGCIILPSYTRYSNGKEDLSCSAEYNKVKEALKLSDKPLIIAHSWDRYSLELMKKGGTSVLDITFDEYLNILGVELDKLFYDIGIERTYILIGVPHRAKQHAFNCMAEKQLNPFSSDSWCEVSQKKYDLVVNGYLSSLAERYENVFFIDPTDVLCDDTNCMTIKNEEPIHTDQSHLSIFGAELVVEYILKEMRNIRGS